MRWREFNTQLSISACISRESYDEDDDDADDHDDDDRKSSLFSS